VTKPIRRIGKFCTLALTFAAFTSLAVAQATPVALNPMQSLSGHRPLEIGALVQGGFGVTEDRGDFRFFMAGAQAGKVLTGNHGPGLLHGNFEYGVQLFPFWQSYTPKFQRELCPTMGPCSAPYTVGGIFTGVSITPIILRWNFAGTKRISPWVQGAGGLLWTNHKYPAFGGPPYNPSNDGPASDTSVWNFTPQFGVGMRYFIRPRRSIDFGANAIHISSASLGDKNPGVNASVQFTVGYTWWK
jgi:lipid A 3-O-deacylase